MGQIKLQVGQVSESVTVTADAVTVNTANGERAGTLSGEQLDEIALRGRDIFDAISLMPGVVDTSDGRDSPSPTSISNIYIAGRPQRFQEHDHRRRDQSRHGLEYHRAQHALDGFGRRGQGADVGLSARKRTQPLVDQRHYQGRRDTISRPGGWYFRNEDLNANNYFSNLAGRPRQEYRYNIGSYYIGGPVYFPKSYRGQKNLFFFFNQEYQNQVVSYSVNEKTVPTALERRAISPNPTTPMAAPITGKRSVEQQDGLPGEHHSHCRASIRRHRRSSRCSHCPISSIRIWPPVTTGTIMWRRPSLTTAARKPPASITLPTQNWQLYLSLSNNADHQNVPYSGGTAGWVAGSLNFVLSPIAYSQPGRLATLHSTNTISPTMFNEASVAVSQNTLNYWPGVSRPGEPDQLSASISRRATPR